MFCFLKCLQPFYLRVSINLGVKRSEVISIVWILTASIVLNIQLCDFIKIFEIFLDTI